MTTVEELERTLHTERDRHAQTMETMERQLQTLRGLLEEQQLSFQRLITRVTRLRVAKGEYLAAQSEGRLVEEKFDTGSPALDECLYTLQDALRAALLSEETVLTRLERAARAFGAPPAPTARTTRLCVSTRALVRGTPSWAQRHARRCAECAGETQRGEKPRRVVSLRLRHTPPLAEREAERRLDVLRVVVVGRCDNPTRVQTVLTEWAQRALRHARDGSGEKAAPTNSAVSAAVEMLLHAMDAKVCVTPIGGGRVRLEAALTTAVHMPLLAPFLHLLRDAAEREYVVRCVIEPLVQRVAALAGWAAEATRYTDMAVKAAEAVIRMVQRGAGPLAMLTPNQNPTEDMMAKLHTILLSLAMFGTKLDITCAVPRGGEVRSMTDAKQRALSLAESFVRLIVPPRPFRVPPLDDAECAEVSVQLRDAPTVFLEILNSAFSSDRRLPSTARAGVVDFLASPKAKIRYGLKLFSELAIDICRPYAPETGVVIADENGKAGRPKATGCTPIADIPPDTVRTNVTLAAQGDALMRRLAELKRCAATESESERRGKEAIERVVDGVLSDALRDELKGDLDSVLAELSDFTKGSVDLLLPFGLDMSDPKQMSTSVLYLNVQLECAP